MAATRVALAGRIEGTVVLGVPRVPDVDAALAREELPVACVAGWHHTIEHIDASSDALDQILGRARAHEIPRLARGQPAGDAFRDGIHLFAWFSDTETTDCVALEPDRDRRLRAFLPKVLEHASLDNSKLCLPRIGHQHVLHRP